jgi:hypothetical protein
VGVDLDIPWWMVADDGGVVEKKKVDSTKKPKE